MTSRLISTPVERVNGTLRVPGDKSISHRALLLGAIAEGPSQVTGFLPGEDCLATMQALRHMGVPIEQLDETTLRITGRGRDGFRTPARPLDMGNSGTAMRLFAGLLCGMGIEARLVGDPSLMTRPMERVAVPLRQMGANIVTTDGKPPLNITGDQRLHGIDFEMPVASAQVKSAVLLAGLFADGATHVTEPAVTRDHTERMLRMFGQPVTQDGPQVTLEPGARLVGTEIDVPGDLSSAAFFLLAGVLSTGGELSIENVGLNPTRTGILQILKLMGASIEIRERRGEAGEPIGTLVVRPGRLSGIEVPPELVPVAIDEFPLVFVAAALAEGRTVISGAEELRHKESDRIGVMVAGLEALGVDVEERPDGAVINGGTLQSGEIDSGGDHRVAMAFAIAGMAAEAAVTIRDTANVATSLPGFARLARSIGLDIREQTDD